MEKREIEEALSVIWEFIERKENNIDKICAEISNQFGKDSFEDLIKNKYLLSDKKGVILTPSGETIAKDLIRRQRLAERLLSDVLEIKEDVNSPIACEFEHILHKEVEESICTLLGHPRQCPHGSPIPEGNCCIKAKETVESIVLPLSKLKSNQKAKIVYILTGKQSQLHKLMSLGIRPGSIITVHQTFPSFVIQTGETQIAFENDVAGNIFARKLSDS